MERANRYIHLLASLLVFIPLLLIQREVLSRNITANDLALAAPVLLYFGLLVVMLSLTHYEAGVLSSEEKKAYRLLVVGSYVLAVPLWVMMILSGRVASSVILTSSASLLFILVDLLMMIARLQDKSRLRHLVSRGVFLPIAISLSLSALTVGPLHWQYILNPVALFFILRAFMQDAFVSRSERS